MWEKWKWSSKWLCFLYPTKSLDKSWIYSRSWSRSSVNPSHSWCFYSRCSRLNWWHLWWERSYRFQCSTVNIYLWKPPMLVFNSSTKIFCRCFQWILRTWKVFIENCGRLDSKKSRSDQSYIPDGQQMSVSIWDIATSMAFNSSPNISIAPFELFLWNTRESICDIIMSNSSRLFLSIFQIVRLKNVFFRKSVTILTSSHVFIFHTFLQCNVMQPIQWLSMKKNFIFLCWYCLRKRIHPTSFEQILIFCEWKIWK